MGDKNKDNEEFGKEEEEEEGKKSRVMRGKGRRWCVMMFQFTMSQKLHNLTDYTITPKSMAKYQLIFDYF